MRINLAERRGEILPNQDFRFNPAEIRSAIRKAGFRTGRIQLVVKGPINKDKGKLLLSLGQGQEIGVVSSPPAEELAGSGRSVHMVLQAIENDLEGFALDLLEILEEE